MNNLSDMIWIEFRKAIRSRMPLFTALGSLFMPFGIGFLIFIARNPELSQKLGLVGAKANLMAYSATNWQSYMGLSAMIIAAGGFFLSCLVISWVFGREFSDGTLKDLLAVPVPRSSIVMAKYIVVDAWSGMLTIVILVAGLIVGAIIQLPDGSGPVIFQGIGLVIATACLVIMVLTPFALFASVGRGYLLPLGLAILAVMMANIIALVGLGEYYPWAVPGLFAQAKGTLSPIGYWVAILTGLAGVVGTYLWWKFADQNR
jgi:ABC-2 type transport system permease protein